MNLTKIESNSKFFLESFPQIKRIIKRLYQGVFVILKGNDFRYEGNIAKISPDDGYEYFYGYYDKSPWDITDRFLIANRAKETSANVAPRESADVCVIDTKKKIIYKVGETHSWNVQQGCLAQWLGPDFQRRIIYNDFRNDNYCSVLFNWENRAEERVLPIPIYDISRDGKTALSLDFSRLHRLRPGYGYSNLKDSTSGDLCPDECCIWKMDIETGVVTELLKYTDFYWFEHNNTMEGAEHKINHIMISPNGKRFMVLHRWYRKGRKHSRLITVNIDGSSMYNLSDNVYVSHCFWKNNDEIISFCRKNDSGDHYYLMRDKTQEYDLLWPVLETDGHCSYSPDGKRVVTDTYPNRERVASVYICDDKDNKVLKVCSVFSPFKYDNEYRCDLHPRWSRKGNMICIDSAHEGKRGIYSIDINH